ncbi:MAG TPA: ABC transporter ATP-binding protein [Aquimonas sp.]|nr:ABC transporter ATP-binding protein [Aquimonas sp.]
MLVLRGIERQYRLASQTVRALDGVSLQIEPGEFVAITGASGSGKSTLLNVLGCLDRPDAGSYQLDGQEVAGLDDEAISAVRNRRIGFVFQSFHLLPRLTVLENVLLPTRFAHTGALPDLQRAQSLLARVGLSARLDHRPNELSGGQIQRVAVARALMMAPSVLLADEPTGNLDSRSAADVLNLFREVHAEGQTVVLVTHDPDVALQAPRLIRLRDGRIEHDGAH